MKQILKQKWFFDVKDIQDPDYNWYRRRIRIVKRLTAQTQEIRRTFQNVLQGPSHEFDYVESIKLTSKADPLYAFTKCIL